MVPKTEINGCCPSLNPKLSVMLFPFNNQLSDGTLLSEDLLQDLWAADIRALEPTALYVKSNLKQWEEMDRAAADLGMEYVCYDIGVDLIGQSRVERDKALDLAAKEVDFCAEALKCPVALIVGSQLASGMSNEEGRKVFAERLVKLSERTKGSGVTLTIEDYGMDPEFTASAGHVLEVLEAAAHPDLKVIFDNGNFLFADEIPTECYERFRGRIRHVHIKDFALREPDGTDWSLTSLSGKQYMTCEIGQGKAEAAQCLALLKKDGYKGWLSLEVGGDEPLGEVVAGAKYVKEIWNTGN